MPAPAVYVIAVVGTVGVAIVFKEFIYPHIAPRIDRWKAEFQAAGKRRAEAKRSAVMGEVALIQRGARKDGYQNIEINDSDSDHPDVDMGNGTSTLGGSAHHSMKNGLLIRRRGGQSETILNKPGDVELDWKMSTSTANGTGSEQPDLRLRKDTGFESIQPIQHMPLSPITVTSIRTCTETTESHKFLDESIQAIPYTPLSPIRTPTPTHVLYNSSSTHSPLETPFSTRVSSPLHEETLLSNTNDTNTATFTHPLLASSPCTADTATASASKAAPGLENVAVPEVATFPPEVGVDDNSVTPSLVSLSSPPALAPSLPPSQLLSPTSLHPSPYQTPPHVHVIPSLSQSYPLDDLLDYDHDLELLSPPSPLSRTNSPFEFAGLSPRPGMAERSTLLLADSGQQISAAPVDNITNSTRNTFLSFSSPTLSASSVFPSSETGYENDSSSSEISSTFSSPSVASNRLGDIGWESLSPHDDHPCQHRSMPLSSRSSPFSVGHPQLQPHHRQQQEWNTEWASMRIPVPADSASITRPQESDVRRPMIPNDNEYGNHPDTQSLGPRNNTRSPSATDSATAWTSAEIHISQSATRLSSNFDTGSELSDLDISNYSDEEYGASTSAAALRSRSMVYTGGVRRDGGMGGSVIGDGNESDTSSWSFTGGSQ